MKNFWHMVHDLKPYVGRLTTTGPVVGIAIGFVGPTKFPVAALVVDANGWNKYVTDPKQLTFIED